MFVALAQRLKPGQLLSVHHRHHVVCRLLLVVGVIFFFISMAGGRRARLKLPAPIQAQMERHYLTDPYPSREDYVDVGKDVGLAPEITKRWFENRRRADRRKGRLCRSCFFFKAPVVDHQHDQNVHLNRPCVTYWKSLQNNNNISLTVPAGPTGLNGSGTDRGAIESGVNQQPDGSAVHPGIVYTANSFVTCEPVEWYRCYYAPCGNVSSSSFNGNGAANYWQEPLNLSLSNVREPPFTWSGVLHNPHSAHSSPPDVPFTPPPMSLDLPSSFLQ